MAKVQLMVLNRKNKVTMQIEQVQVSIEGMGLNKQSSIKYWNLS